MLLEMRFIICVVKSALVFIMGSLNQIQTSKKPRKKMQRARVIIESGGCVFIVVKQRIVSVLVVDALFAFSAPKSKGDNTQKYPKYFPVMTPVLDNKGEVQINQLKEEVGYKYKKEVTKWTCYHAAHQEG
mmetsp:Transcript_18518/g.31818  ORF Transcript_18518/g.31818 Transcript_18518/m.31818 type:complete len:130 (-) Transcript_18518:179-568(-)